MNIISYYSVTFRCVFIWLFKWCVLAKSLPQMLHRYIFSPVWIMVCCLSTLGSANVLPHTVHSWGFSPVWFRLCIFRVYNVEYSLLHTSHVNGFIPAWDWICFLATEDCEKFFPHILQLKGLSPLWILECAVKRPLDTNLERVKINLGFFLRIVKWW